MKCVVQEIDGEGLTALMGKTITLFCSAYIYTGRLVGVNDTCVKLSDAKIVYETGELNVGGWKDAQLLPHDWYVQIAAVESFGILK